MAKEYKLNGLDTFGKQSSVIKVDTMTYIPYGRKQRLPKVP